MPTPLPLVFSQTTPLYAAGAAPNMRRAQPPERGPPLPHPPLRVFDSPCKSVCRIDDRLGWCIGCRRTRAEIKAWSTATPSEKQIILDRLDGRAAQEAEILAHPAHPPARPLS
ncbi:MAG: DUF1289 domain-containing protein [Magnetospirillum sp.]|nr:DUF1289 domain-containing protein [Magnetospirillum sp.]